MPSHWDETQASKLTDIHQEVQALDCTNNVSSQLNVIGNDLSWFRQYNTYVGTKDIDTMIATEQNTVKEFQTEVASGKSNNVYCQLKKAIILQQTDLIGSTIKGSIQ